MIGLIGLKCLLWNINCLDGCLWISFSRIVFLKYCIKENSLFLNINFFFKI